MLARSKRFLPMNLVSALGPWGKAWGVLVLVLIAFCAWALITARQDLQGHAVVLADDLLTLADEAVIADVSRYDLRLHAVMADSGGPQGLAAPALAETLRTIWAADPNVRSLTLVLSSGAVSTRVLRSGAAPDPALIRDLAARPELDRQGLDIRGIQRPGRPPEIAIIARCAGPACGGVAAAVVFLEPGWLKSIFDKLKVGRAGEAGLFDQEGHLLAQVQAAGSDGEAEQRVERALPNLPHDRMTVWRDAAYPDGMIRRVSLAWVGDLPLVIFVSLSAADFMRGWRVLGVMLVIALAVMLAGFVILTLRLWHQLVDKQRVEQDLRTANAQLTRLARTDGLTQLLNRRGFDEALQQEWDRCRLLQQPISLLMIDADRFKRYNDRFGHPAGDTVLRAIADCVVRCVGNDGELAARYGGEELAVILPDTRGAEAYRVAERMRAAVEALGSVTISIGVGCAEMPFEGSVEALLAAADAALYQSKTRGRNRVTILPVIAPAAGLYS